MLFEFRASHFTQVSSIEQEEEGPGHANHVSIIREYRAKIEAKLFEICARIVKLIGKKLVPAVGNGDSKVFYLKMKGDYHRYLAEFKTGNDRKAAVENTLTAYKSTQSRVVQCAEGEGPIIYFISFVLVLLVLSENAFEMAYFLWVVFKYTIESCFHEKIVFCTRNGCSWRGPSNTVQLHYLSSIRLGDTTSQSVGDTEHVSKPAGVSGTITTALANAGYTLEGSEVELALNPFRLAFETKNLKILEPALDCLHYNPTSAEGTSYCCSIHKVQSPWGTFAWSYQTLLQYCSSQQEPYKLSDIKGNADTDD
ncbi:hypothetical protein CRYUN_Cryun09bG0163300 [Craigia yunnanensis]